MHLEFPELRHEQEHRAMLQEFFAIGEEVIPNSLKISDEETYAQYIQRHKDSSEGKNLKPGRVPNTLYFIINDDDDKIVGAIHVRRELNDSLKNHAGNIGYGIRPSERKKGYATIGLALALEKCREKGLDKVLLTCKKGNIGSAKTIINNGGILDSEYDLEGITHQRYRITL